MLNVLIAGILGAFGGSLVAGGLEPFFRTLSYGINQIVPNRIISEDILIRLYISKKIEKEEFLTLMKRLGYSENNAMRLVDYYKNQLTFREYIEAYRRNEIDLDKLKEIAKNSGLSEDDLKLLLKITEPVASPSDIIRFAVREAYMDDVAKEWGYDEDFEKTLKMAKEDLQKVGMSPDLLKKYWRAHWELPSPSMGFEFLHRLNPDVLKVRAKAYEEMGLKKENLEFKLKDLERLLKYNDILPYYRDKIIAISYNPLTRVDLRRIYQMGLISDEECLARLMEYGYSKSDAELLLKWFKALKMGAERDLSKSEILRLYRNRIITDRSQIIEMLKNLGYSEEECELLILLEDYKIYNEEIKDKINTYVLQFVNNKISEEDLITKLNELNLSSTQIDSIVLKAVERKKRRIKHPSKEDLKRWLKLQIIDINTYIEKMRGLGYSDDDIAYYIHEICNEIERGE